MACFDPSSRSLLQAMALKTCETFHTLAACNNAVNSQHILAEYRFLRNKQKIEKRLKNRKMPSVPWRTENNHMVHIILNHMMEYKDVATSPFIYTLNTFTHHHIRQFKNVPFQCKHSNAYWKTLFSKLF